MGVELVEIFGPIMVYLAGIGAYVGRVRQGRPSPLDFHKTKCGMQHKWLHRCPVHRANEMTPASQDCEACWVISASECIGHPCVWRWVRGFLLAPLWPLMMPVLLGMRAMAPKPSRKERRSIEADIARLEKELGM